VTDHNGGDRETTSTAEMLAGLAAVSEADLAMMISCAVYIRAARRRVSPRSVADELFRELPAEEDWRGIRPHVQALLDAIGEQR
jgi:hypothetical protein